MKTDKATDPIDGVSLAVNEVRLVGRLSQDPEERVLPSGDSVWTFRLVVARPAGGKSRQSVDTLECAVWGGRVRKSAASWAAGDVVEVAGALRRRFFSTGAGRASRVEVEVASGRMVRRAERHPSLSDRMSTPMLGLGWNDVAFSGSSRPACATRTTRSKSGAGISTATPSTVLIRVRASSTEWWKPTRRSLRREGAEQLVVEDLDGGPVGRQRERDGRPALAIGGDERVLGECCEGVRGGDRGEGRRVGTGSAELLERRAEDDPVNGAQEQGSVGLVDEHGESAVGRTSGSLLLHPEIGGIAVVPVGDQGTRAGQRRVETVDVIHVAQGPDSVPLVGSVDVLVQRRRRERSVHELADLRGAAMDQQDGRGVELPRAHPVGELRHLLRMDALVRDDRAIVGARSRGGRCRALRRGRGP